MHTNLLPLLAGKENSGQVIGGISEIQVSAVQPQRVGLVAVEQVDEPLPKVIAQVQLFQPR